jgi:hypothetical protein
MISAAVKEKATTLRRRASDMMTAGRFDILLEEEQKFCEALGLRKDLIMEIARTESDWAFILKIDALLETASKEIIRRGLGRKILNGIAHNDPLWNDGLWGYVDSLPMNGKMSVLKLLEAAGCPTEEHDFIEAVRGLKKSYANNIKVLGVALIELIKKRPDKTHLLKTLSAVENYDEAGLIGIYEGDGGFLRFCILERTMRFLFFAYHIALKRSAVWPLERS